VKKIDAFILAAGSSTRLGRDKLYLRIDGESVIHRAARAFLLDDVRRVMVVAGYEPEKMERELADLPVQIIRNRSYHEGMSASIKAVLPHLDDAEGALFHLGDKPFITRETVERMVQIFGEKETHLLVPLYGGQKGHPILLDPFFFRHEMAHVSGDEGLRSIIEAHREETVFIEGDEGAILDIDTEEDVKSLVRRGYNVEEG
jgi:molybdenum cofactor cytidylyltransferase